MIPCAQNVDEETLEIWFEDPECPLLTWKEVEEKNIRTEPLKKDPIDIAISIMEHNWRYLVTEQFGINVLSIYARAALPSSHPIFTQNEE